jgi:hypothetical protein
MTFPELNHLQNAGTRNVLLPSAINLQQSTNHTYSKWLCAELDLRVGIGHDLLQEIRSNAAVLNFYSRKQKQETRGQQEMKNVARSQKSASGKKSQLVQEYSRNWNCIQILLKLSPRTVEEKRLCLKGLQAISSTQDFSFFPEIHNHASIKPMKSGEKISWIWRVSMLEEPKECSNRTLQELESEWEGEGKHHLPL